MLGSSDGSAPKKRSLGMFTPSRSPLELARERARSLDEAGARVEFDAPLGRALKTTVSLCPDCLAHVPALVVEEAGRVLVRKRCPEHGLKVAVLENDARYYFLSNKDKSGRVFALDRVFNIPAFPGAGLAGEACCEGGACDSTDQTTNKTCTVLVEVTDACNLACPVCYSDAKGERQLPREKFERYIEALIEKKGGLDSVQLTGGEALLHPDVFDMVAFLASHPKVKKVYLPTNGLLLLKERRAIRLARYRDKLMVLLQFDGATDDSDRALRSATPGRTRREVVRALGDLGIFMQLTMTLARGVNDLEVGEVIELALRHEHVKVVALQPATYSGRYELEPDPLTRLTLSDVVKAVVRQTRRAREADFVPIPCSHPNCGWITLFVRRFGVVHNIVRYVDMPRVLDQVSYRTLLSTAELRGAVGGGSPLKRAIAGVGKRLIRSHDMFTVAIKPFMDRHSYDQDRVDHCCHHILDTKGAPLSFCEYNAVLRQRDPWTELPKLT
ncbi:MAG: radical SAM protein [Polyangiaceae bacterium]